LRIKGNSHIESKDQQLELKDGTLAYFPAGVDYKRVTREREEYIAIHLKSYGEHGVKIETVDQCDMLIPLFEAMHTEWERGNAASRNRCMSILYHIFEELSSRFDQREINIPKSIAPGVEYLQKHFRTNDITISSLAALCHVSETYFRRIYVEIFGISPMQTLLDLRFDYAKNLLRSGYYQTKQIAAMAGFSDVKYFRTAFKKRFGITVKEYAEQYVRE
jgi:AraC-like DNA-binding protein